MKESAFSPAAAAQPGRSAVGVFSEDPLRVDGLRTVLEADGQWEVLPMAGPDPAAAGRLSLAILDIGGRSLLMPLLGHLRRQQPVLPVLVMGPVLEEDQVMELVRQGAKGYLSHTATERELKTALGIVMEGSLWVPRRLLARLLADRQDLEVQPPALTPREREVLSLLVGGRSNREIAESLAVDEATIKAHLSRLMRKLGVRNRIALTVYALGGRMDP